MESQSATAGGGTQGKDYQQHRQEQMFLTNFNDYWVRLSDFTVVSNEILLLHVPRLTSFFNSDCKRHRYIG
jgi:hypothetical protein